ncbi:MAG TPA: nitrate reductase molybdenum cofactor assembly chaperone [Bacillota bacterium]|nr:nitrate reductase molybdenum cofactor assembly chaperone [Bacillota bacterium]
MSQTVYQMIGYLLKYPTEDMQKALPDICIEIEKVAAKPVIEKVHQFIDHCERMSLDEWISYYVEYFDFGRLTNLYVTYLKFGEKRERGIELLKLKQYYEAHGFTVTDKELPDYLPLMLEFCAHVPVEVSNELLHVYSKTIHQIHDQLKKVNSYYSSLLDALFLQMKDNGVKNVLEA